MARRDQVVVGAWPWGWSAELIDALVPSPRKEEKGPTVAKAPVKTWKLVDALADGAGISRTKVRREIAAGRVLVDSVVEFDADRSVTSDSEVEWRSDRTP